MAWRGIFNRRGWRARSSHLITVLWLVTAPSFAADPVLARVVAIAPDRVTVTIADTDTRRVITLPPDESVAQFSPGQLVRLWPGEADPDPHGILRGARLTPLDRGGTGIDRTGVRARLMRGAAVGHAPPGGRRSGR